MPQDSNGSYNKYETAVLPGFEAMAKGLNITGDSRDISSTTSYVFGIYKK